MPLFALFPLRFIAFIHTVPPNFIAHRKFTSWYLCCLFCSDEHQKSKVTSHRRCDWVKVYFYPLGSEFKVNFDVVVDWVIKNIPNLFVCFVLFFPTKFPFWIFLHYHVSICLWESISTWSAIELKTWQLCYFLSFIEFRSKGVSTCTQTHTHTKKKSTEVQHTQTFYRSELTGLNS